MTPEEIDILLYRPLQDGIEYENLMPFSDCSSVLLAEGDTEQAINQMAIWAKKYQYHTKLLADSVFKKYSLINLCKELHDFLFNHLQYKIDGYKQKLRSPACSWSTRSQGIDCKSYSIFASSVLLNLGVAHYLRRVVYEKAKGFSHVYVVIPKDQKTFDLSKGYYTIDATVKFTDEVTFVSKDDVFMNIENSALGSVVTAALANSVAKVISVVTDLLIQGFLNEIFGCDDAAYEAPIVQYKLKLQLLEPLTKMLNNLDDAISIDNTVRVEHIFNAIFKEIDLGIAHLRNETAFSQRDECIAETLSAALKYAEEVKKVLDIFYTNFKTNYSHLNIREYYGSANVNQRTLYFVVENDTNPIKAEYRLIVIERDKNQYGLEPVFGFEVNPLEWLATNISHLKLTYNDGREKDYKKEITPLIDKAVALREKFYIGGEGLYYAEQPIQEEMNAIWLKYDDNYSKFLEEKAQKNIAANEIALAEYSKRFNQAVEENLLAEKRKKNKMQLGIGLAIAALLIAINTEKEE